jgi:hypothetical protein
MKPFPIKASYYMRQTFYCQAIAELNNDPVPYGKVDKKSKRWPVKKDPAIHS